MKKTASIILLLIVFVVLIFHNSAKAYKAEVVYVLDGDTIIVRYQKAKITVRLQGIDCPEKGQPYSKNARSFTIASALNKTVTVNIKGKDQYGRTLAEVILPDKKSLNQELVKAGYAWWYRKYAPNDRTLKALEAGARAAKRGLWADKNSIPPWEWRRGEHGRRTKK